MDFRLSPEYRGSQSNCRSFYANSLDPTVSIPFCRMTSSFSDARIPSSDISLSFACIMARVFSSISSIFIPAVLRILLRGAVDDIFQISGYKCCGFFFYAELLFERPVDANNLCIDEARKLTQQHLIPARSLGRRIDYEAIVRLSFVEMRWSRIFDYPDKSRKRQGQQNLPVLLTFETVCRFPQLFRRCHKDSSD